MDTPRIGFPKLWPSSVNSPPLREGKTDRASIRFSGLGEPPDEFRRSNVTADFAQACRQAGVTPGQVLLDNLKAENELGSGATSKVYRITTPGLAGFILRDAPGVRGKLESMSSGQRLSFSRNGRFTPVNQQHPWRNRDNIGLTIGEIGHSDSSSGIGKIEVQRLIPGRTAGSYFEKQREAALQSSEYYHPIEDLMMETVSEPEFVESLQAAREAGETLEDYERFQQLYAGYVNLLAKLPQSAYDEVADIMASGYQEGYGLDLNHAANTMILEPGEDPRSMGRFGLVDTRKLGDPSEGQYEPMTMHQFAYALMVGVDPYNTEIFKKHFSVIQDPALKSRYQDNFKTVMTMCKRADDKFQVTRQAEAWEQVKREDIIAAQPWMAEHGFDDPPFDWPVLSWLKSQ